MTFSITPTNSLFMGDGIMRCATRWLTIAMTEGDLAMAPAVVRPLHSTGLDAITEALEELRLRAPKACAPGRGQLLDFDYGRLER